MSTTYEVRVVGHLDDHWATWLHGCTVQRRDDGTTVVTASLADQSELHGLLGRIRDLGVPLVSLFALGPDAPGAASPRERSTPRSPGSARPDPKEPS